MKLDKVTSNLNKSTLNAQTKYADKLEMKASVKRPWR